MQQPIMKQLILKQPIVKMKQLVVHEAASDSAFAKHVAPNNITDHPTHPTNVVLFNFLLRGQLLCFLKRFPKINFVIFFGFKTPLIFSLKKSRC
jgi:hypothetical protein